MFMYLSTMPDQLKKSLQPVLNNHPGPSENKPSLPASLVAGRCFQGRQGAASRDGGRSKTCLQQFGAV